jgi:hypothetical protein
MFQRTYECASCFPETGLVPPVISGLVNGMDGRRGLCLLAILFAFCLPGVACAQGLAGFGMPVATFGQPTVPLLSPPNFYVGWMQSLKSTKLVFDDRGPGLFLGGNHWWKSAGWWFGIEEKVNVTDACGIVIDAWLLLPQNRRGIEYERTQRTFFEVIDIPEEEGPDTIIVIPHTQIVPGSRSWTTRDDWWFLDGTFSWGRSNTFQIIGGGRYEHFSTRFKKPDEVIAIPSVGTDTIDITVNSFLPIIGVQSGLNGTENSFSLKLIGFPMVYGNATHFETGEAGTATRIESKGTFRRAYWWEILGQCSRNLFPGANVGAFVRWNVIHGSANFHSELQPNHISAEDDQGTFDRNTITLGGNFSLSFTSPF